MDIDDTPEEAAFRAEARDWLDAHAIPKGHPDDFSLGLWTGAYDEETYVRRCPQWQRTLFDGGWAGMLRTARLRVGEATAHRHVRSRDQRPTRTSRPDTRRG